MTKAGVRQVRRCRGAAWVLAVGSLLATATSGTAPAAADAPSTERSTNTVTTSERGCIEGGTASPANSEALMKLVPQEYHDELAPGPGGTPLLLLWDYVCESVSVDGREGTPTVVHIAAVELTSGEYYMLWMATDNVTMFSQYRRMGLPVRYVPRSTARVTSSIGAVQVEFAVRGAGMDHSIRFGPVALAEGPITSEAGVTFVHDGPRGELSLATFIHYAPDAFPVPAPADWRTMVPKFERLFLEPDGANGIGFLVRLDSDTTLFRAPGRR
jgi:hypothetical protein